MRTFIAVDIADEVRGRIEQVTAGLRGRLAGARWVPARNLHLTLRFLGETAEGDLAALKEGLSSLAGKVPRFELVYCGLGFFPSPRRPRIFWVGVGETPPPMMLLQQEVERLARSLGFEPEERPFSPHLTLARFKVPRPCSDCEKVAVEYQDQGFGCSPADSVTLYRSILKPAGAQYEALSRFVLGGLTGAA